MFQLRVGRVQGEELSRAQIILGLEVLIVENEAINSRIQLQITFVSDVT